MKVVPSPMCSCGEAEQDTLTTSCRNFRQLREEMCPDPIHVPLEEKLYWAVDVLQKTARFFRRTGLLVKKHKLASKKRT